MPSTVAPLEMVTILLLVEGLNCKLSCFDQRIGQNAQQSEEKNETTKAEIH